MARKEPGIEQRHRNHCKYKGTRIEGRCKCPWQAKIYDKRVKKEKTLGTFPTRALAKAAREDAMAALRRGTLHTATAKMTVEQGFYLLLQGRAEGRILTPEDRIYKPDPLNHDRLHIERFWLRDWGPRQLSGIRRHELRGYAEELRVRGVSRAVIYSAFTPLKALFKRAMDYPDLNIDVNPAAELGLPRHNGRRERVAPPQESLELIAALSDLEDQVRWAMGFFAAVRKSEGRALFTEDVDLEAGWIHVRRQWNDKVKGYIPTKNHRERYVPIVDLLRPFLERQMHHLHSLPADRCCGGLLAPRIEAIRSALPARSMPQIAQRAGMSLNETSHAIEHLRRHSAEFGWTMSHVGGGRPALNSYGEGRYHEIILDEARANGERPTAVANPKGHFLNKGRLNQPYHYGNLRARAKRDWAAAGLNPIMLHSTRHTAITMWDAAGVPAKLIEDWADHTDIQFTRKVYVHAIPGSEQDAIQKLNAFYEGQLPRRLLPPGDS
jgi:integrase